jgi:hypothetical protein
VSRKLRNFLADTYVVENVNPLTTISEDFPIQIDDQDDRDNITLFCTIFVAVERNDRIRLEISGRIPITKSIADLAEIYHGSTDRRWGRIVLRFNPEQIDLVITLAVKIRETAHLGATVGNPEWERISARTISSLHRFVRVVKEYRAEQS